MLQRTLQTSVPAETALQHHARRKTEEKPWTMKCLEIVRTRKYLKVAWTKKRLKMIQIKHTSSVGNVGMTYMDQQIAPR